MTNSQEIVEHVVNGLKGLPIFTVVWDSKRVSFKVYQIWRVSWSSELHYDRVGSPRDDVITPVKDRENATIYMQGRVRLGGQLSIEQNSLIGYGFNVFLHCQLLKYLSDSINVPDAFKYDFTIEPKQCLTNKSSSSTSSATTVSPSPGSTPSTPPGSGSTAS